MSIIISGAIVVITIILKFAFPEIFSFLFGKGLDKIFSKIPNPMILLKKERRSRFRKVIGSPEYKNFALEVMKHYYLFEKYGDVFFTVINGKLFPVMCFKGVPYCAKSSIQDFDFLSNKTQSVFNFDLTEHQGYRNYIYYKEYSELLEGLIKYPDRPGYMLDELELNKNGEVASVKVHVGTFAENVYSTHILEYELYCIYKKYRNRDLNNPDVWNKIMSLLKRRNQIHSLNQNESEAYYGNWRRLYESIRKMQNTHSLLSVQMLVVVKSSRTHKYELKIVQRSNKTVNMHGIYQFIPAGGFEVLNDSDDGVYSENELRNEYSAGCAVFREYLEELLNRPEFEGNGTGNLEERLLKDPGILEIEKLITEGKAIFRFLGSVVALDGLRHELSFLLLIKDEEYDAGNKFITNWEGKKGRIEENVSVQNFEANKEIWSNIHSPSAAMWHLFKQTDLYQQVLEEDLRNELSSTL